MYKGRNPKVFLRVVNDSFVKILVGFGIYFQTVLRQNLSEFHFREQGRNALLFLNSFE